MTNQHPEPVGSLEGSDQQSVGLTRAEKTLTTKGEELIEQLRLIAGNPGHYSLGNFCRIITQAAETIRSQADALQALIGEGGGLSLEDLTHLQLFGLIDAATEKSEGERTIDVQAFREAFDELKADHCTATDTGAHGHKYVVDDRGLFCRVCGLAAWRHQPLPNVPVDGRLRGAQGLSDGPEIATSGDEAESGGPTRARIPCATFGTCAQPVCIAFGCQIAMRAQSDSDQGEELGTTRAASEPLTDPVNHQIPDRDPVNSTAGGR